MQILLITDHYPPEVGSASHLFFDLADGLTSRGHAVKVVTSHPRQYNLANEVVSNSEMRQPVKPGPANVVRIRTLVAPKDNALLRGLEMFTDSAFLSLEILISMLRRKADVAVVYSPPLPLALVSVLMGRLTGVPVVTNVQDLYPQTVIDVGLLRNRVLIAFFRLTERIVYDCSAAITVHSEGNKEYVSRAAHRGNQVRVILNCSRREPLLQDDITREHQKETLGFKGRTLVTYAGVMAVHQGLEVVLETAEILKNNHDIGFLIVGDGLERDRLTRKADIMRLDNIKFMGFQSREEYDRIIAASDLVLVTLRKDVSPYVVPGKIQSIMHAGKPIIASVPMHGNAAEMIRISESGICCEPGNPSDMARAIMELSQNRERQLTMGENGSRYASANFSIAAASATYEELFSEMNIEKSRM